MQVELVAIKSKLENFLSESIHRSIGRIILSDFSSALQAIQKGRCQITHEIIQSINKDAATGRSDKLQWKLAHINIRGNEKADELDKKSRFCPQSANLTTPVEANPVASCRLTNNNFEFSIPALNCNRVLASIIFRLRPTHVRGMKISADEQRSYSSY